MAKLTEVSVLCEILVVTKIAWLLCAARGVHVTHGTWCREVAEVRMLQGRGNRRRRPPAQRGRPWVSVQTAQAICTALRASQCAWKDTLPSGEQDGASSCLAVQPSAETCCAGVSGACQDVWPPLRLHSSPACGPSRLLPTCLPLLGPGHSLGSSIPVSQTWTCCSRVRGRWKPVPPVGPHVDTMTFHRAWDELAAPLTSFPGASHTLRQSATGRTVRPGGALQAACWLLRCFHDEAEWSSLWTCQGSADVQVQVGHPSLLGGCLGVDGGSGRPT